MLNHVRPNYSIVYLSTDPNSLLTGNLTGNFAKNRHLAQRSLQIVASWQGVRDKFPTQRNRELFRRNRELFSRNREIYSAKSKITPDEVFGTHKVLIQRLEFDNRLGVGASGPECDRR